MKRQLPDTTGVVIVDNDDDNDDTDNSKIKRLRCSDSKREALDTSTQTVENTTDASKSAETTTKTTTKTTTTTTDFRVAQFGVDGPIRLASEVSREQGPFICIGCRSELILKKGDIRIPHFAHRGGDVCSGGESVIHAQAKRLVELHFNRLQFHDNLQCHLHRSPAHTNFTNTSHINYTAKIEHKLGDYKIDVMIMKQEVKDVVPIPYAAIEIQHTHPIGFDKRKNLLTSGIKVFEVNAKDVIDSISSTSSMNVRIDYDSEIECLTCKTDLWWQRPKPRRRLDPHRDRLAFQVSNVDYYKPWVKTGWDTDSAKQPLPILRVWGTTSEGYSVLVHTHDFLPYFWIEIPENDLKDSESYVVRFRQALEAALWLQHQQSTDEYNAYKDLTRLILHIEVSTRHRSIWGYEQMTKPHAAFMKISVAVPNIVAKARKILESGIVISKKIADEYGKHPLCREVTSLPSTAQALPAVESDLLAQLPLDEPSALTQFVVYEANVAFGLRFMIDQGISPGGWVELPTNGYTVRRRRDDKYTHGTELATSRMQYELDCSYKRFVVHPADDPGWARTAPIRIFSYDIECAGRPAHFPDAKHDPIIQIGCTLKTKGIPFSSSELPGFSPHLAEEHIDKSCERKSSRTTATTSTNKSSSIGTDAVRLYQRVFTLNKCSEIPGADRVQCQFEQNLLIRWAEFVRGEADPDVLMSYNGERFDMPYVYDRATVLNVQKEVMELGKLIGNVSREREAQFESKAFGKTVSRDFPIIGVIVFDLYKIIKREHKLRSYTLNSVSAYFLKQVKDDVHWSSISKLQAGTNDDRRRLAIYCLRDTELPIRIEEKLWLLTNLTEMARVTGVTIDMLLNRGQQIKVYSKLLRKCGPRNVLLPSMSFDDDSSFEGATVLSAKKGVYRNNSVADFTSLYPSIMCANNLCYSTSVSDKRILTERGLTEKENCITIPSNHSDGSEVTACFVTKNTFAGLLPEILSELMAARSVAKTQSSVAKDLGAKMVLTGRGNALKITANSVYGFVAAQTMMMKSISDTVTSFGREAIFKAKTLHETYYPEAEVFYGDTDSIMVRWPKEYNREKVFKLAKDATEKISTHFTAPMKLLFEKYYSIMLMLGNAKKYAGNILMMSVLTTDNPKRLTSFDF